MRGIFVRTKEPLAGEKQLIKFVQNVQYSYENNYYNKRSKAIS